MFSKILKLIITIAIVFNPGSIITQEKREYLCGIAVGYPPYQYVSRGKPAGLDYDAAVLVMKNAGLRVRFVQGEWDDLMFNLAHNTGKIDILCGAEVNDVRSRFMDFSEIYYKRYNAVFVLKNSEIKNINELYGRIIAGDRHSFLERSFGEDKKKIRVMQTRSKEESFTMLSEGRVVAAIAPLKVGYYISRNMGISVKTIGIKDPGSPVAFAVAKGNRDLLIRINASVRKMKKERKFDEILSRY